MSPHAVVSSCLAFSPLHHVMRLFSVTVSKRLLPSVISTVKRPFLSGLSSPFHARHVAARQIVPPLYSVCQFLSLLKKPGLFIAQFSFRPVILPDDFLYLPLKCRCYVLAFLVASHFKGIHSAYAEICMFTSAAAVFVGLHLVDKISVFKYCAAHLEHLET